MSSLFLAPLVSYLSDVENLATYYNVTHPVIREVLSDDYFLDLEFLTKLLITCNKTLRVETDRMGHPVVLYLPYLSEVVDVGLLDVGDVPVPQVVDDPREVDVPRERPRDVLKGRYKLQQTEICRSCPFSLFKYHCTELHNRRGLKFLSGRIMKMSRNSVTPSPSY